MAMAPAARRRTPRDVPHAMAATMRTLRPHRRRRRRHQASRGDALPQTRRQPRNRQETRKAPGRPERGRSGNRQARGKELTIARVPPRITPLVLAHPESACVRPPAPSLRPQIGKIGNSSHFSHIAYFAPLSYVAKEHTPEKGSGRSVAERSRGKGVRGGFGWLRLSQGCLRTSERV